MMLEESACSYCDKLYDTPTGQALKGPKDEPVCPECYSHCEYKIIDEALLRVSRTEKISLKKLAERLQVLIIKQEE